MIEKTALKTGERRNASVLFSDMKGFTALSESMDPEEMDSLMNRVFALFESIIKKYDGVVEKYIGDALVAVFGVPRVHEDDAFRAVTAALEFHHENTRRNASVQFRTGIDSGLVTTGRRGAYSVVTGRAMSAAARLQETAVDGTVVVSNTVREVCANEFLYGKEQVLDLKGKEDPIRAFRVLGKNHLPFEYDSPFHGREDLLSRMVKTYLTKSEGGISGFTLTGEPGTGKTRTVAEFIARIEVLPEFEAPILYTRARQFRNLPFAAVCELIIGHLRIDFVDDEQVVAETLSTALDIDREKAMMFAELVARRTFSSEGEMFVLLNLIFEKIMLRAADEPYSAVMFIDNIHIVDRWSRNFLRFFLANGRILPFFILAGRAEDRGYRTAFADLSHERLGPLDENEARRILASLVPGDTKPDTVTQILRNASGNPLYLEEYAGFILEGPLEGELPPNIQTLMLATVEEYDVAIREFLKRLSVFHRSFTLEDAEFLQLQAGGKGDHASIALSFYVRQGHLGRQGASYYFRHDLFRRTLYNTLLNQNKKILHGHVADRLMGQTPHNRINLLHHLSAAERFDELEREFFSDGRNLYNYDFLVYLNILLSRITKEDDRYFTFLYSKYAILFNTGRTGGGSAILRELVNLCISNKNDEYLARVYHILSANHLAADSFNKAMICARQAIRYYKKTNQAHRSIPNVQLYYANAALFSNDLDLNLKIVESMTPYGGGRRYDNQSEARVERLIHTGEYVAAEQLLKSRLEGVDPSSDEMSFGGYHKLCSLYLRTYNAEELRKLCEQLLRSKVQSIQESSETYAMLAVGNYLSGVEENNLDHMSLAEHFKNQMQNDLSVVETTRLIAVAYRILGDSKKSLMLAKEGVQIGMRHTVFYHQFGLVVLLAETYIELGDEENALLFLNEADFIVELNPLLDPQEETVYWYLKYCCEKKHHHLERAWNLLHREKDRIGEKKAVEALLASRIYGRIEKDWNENRGNYGRNGKLE
jgi:class 3 adenylate cyclase